MNHVSSFLYYCCPECDFKISTEEKFIEHAIANHDKSKTLLDNSAKDELDYDSDVEGLKMVKKEEITNFNEYWDSQDFRNNALIEIVEPVIEIHESDKKCTSKSNHICVKCDKSFCTLPQFKKHVSVIHELKIYQCDKCDETFDSANRLKKHKIQFHDEREKIYCDKCDKSFSTNAKLINHKAVVHEGLRNFQCDQCSKAFGSQKVLKVHIINVHEGGRNHKCDKCGKGNLI